jgi:hypothetical protein
LITRVTITLKPLTTPDNMDFDDAECPELVQGFSQVFLMDSDDPVEDALDIFHDDIAIANLDDFDISFETTQLTAHEALALGDIHYPCVFDITMEPELEHHL